MSNPPAAVNPPMLQPVEASGPSLRLRGVLDAGAFAAITLLVFSLPWERSLLIPGLGSVGRVIGVPVVAIVLLTLFDRGRVRLRQPSAFLMVSALFTLWAIASALWSLDPQQSVGRASTYVQLLVMAWMIWQVVTDERRQRQIMQAYVLGAYVAVIALAIAFVTSGPGDTVVRYTAFNFDDQNYVASRAVLAMPLAWFLVLRGRRNVLLWVNLAFLPACLFLVGLTASRGALVMSIVALMIVPLTLSTLGLGRRLLFLGMLIAGGLLVATAVPEGNLERLAETTTRLAEGSFTGRERIWRAGVEVVLDSSAPVVVGSGAGTFRLATLPVLGIMRSSHNAYLSVLVELGLVGVVLFVAMLFVAVAPSVTLPGPDKWLYVFLWLALLVANSSLNWDYERATWFTLTLITTRRAWVLRAPEQDT